MTPQTEVPVERIVSAAIRWNGLVFEGRRHAHIIPKVIEAGCDYVTQDMQGFVTASKEFVTRQQAKKIAWQAGQITEARYNSGTKLLSEDLW